MISMTPETLRQKYEEAETTENIIFYGYLY